MSGTTEESDIKLGGQLSENTIAFNVNTVEEPILVLKENGDIFVKGRLAENDKEVVSAMREFLRSTGHLK